ncbi:Spore coat polysaccharide biosynthesis protein SpsA [compost metagenome]
MMASITVVVPTYNKADYIQETLKSIYAQTFRDWKLLVIDDASTDQTISIVQNMIDPLQARFVILPTNQGICHVLNKALEFIDTEYFIQVDGDDWIEPDTLHVLYNEMIHQPKKTALIYANTSHWHINQGETLYKKVKQRNFLNRYDFATYDHMVQPRFYRTSCVKEAGGWEIDDLTGGKLMEDRRMLLRLLDNYSFAYVDRDLYHFRYHTNNLSQDSNAFIYNKLRKYYTDCALQRWGGHYTAHMIGPPHLWQSIRLEPVYVD